MTYLQRLVFLSVVLATVLAGLLSPPLKVSAVTPAPDAISTIKLDEPAGSWNETLTRNYTPALTSTQVVTAAPALIKLAERSALSPTAPAVPRTADVSVQALDCNPTGGTGGLAVGTHDVIIAGRPATVIVGEGYKPETPTYLAFYLHGDEGGYNFHASPFNLVNQFINEESWIYVAPQAPQYNGAYPWYASGVGANTTLIEANAELLRDVLNDTFAKYNVCRDILFGASASGGSWFYDGYFYPHNGGQYPAFMNINCGSSGINNNGVNVWNFYGYYQKLQTLSQNADIVARTELRYTVGTDDFLYDEAVAAVNTYFSLEFGVSTDYLQDVGHCAYDLPAKISDYWRTKAASLDTNGETYQVYLPIILVKP